jgi:peptidoglycan-N-acetylglucosamine deacetylase
MLRLLSLFGIFLPRVLRKRVMYWKAVKQSIKHTVAWVHLPQNHPDTVLLTFDDGPHPVHTPAVLKLLSRYDARAVFFVVGSRVDRAPQLLKAVLDEGHVIGNHGYMHPLGRQFPFFSYLDDLRRCQREIKMHTGELATLFRPPLGVFTPTTMMAPRLVGLQPVLWSIDSYDLGPNCGGFKDKTHAESCARQLASQLGTKPHLKEIMLFHDEHTHIETLLEPVLDVLKSRKCNLRSGVDHIST